MGRHHPNPRCQHQPRQVSQGPHHLQRVSPPPLSFTDPNVYYQTYENYDEVNFYRESLFQILPKSNFDLHDQLMNDENLKYACMHSGNSRRMRSRNAPRRKSSTWKTRSSISTTTPSIPIRYTSPTAQRWFSSISNPESISAVCSRPQISAKPPLSCSWSRNCLVSCTSGSFRIVPMNSWATRSTTMIV